jgi:hypothetical protein
VLCSHVLLAAENTETKGGPFGLGAAPSAGDISRTQFFDEPLIPIREPNVQENLALVAALERFGLRTVRDNFSSLTDFLDRNPDSPWVESLETRLGSEYYRVGRYSKAIKSWESVWKSGKSKTGDIVTRLANRAGGELAMMYARLGRMAELRPMLAELGKKSSRGLNPLHFRGASDGLWSMEHRPEVSFRCGPLALDRICAATERAKAGNPLIQEREQSGALSGQLGRDYTSERRKGAR